jgi:catechol 2,3-dioxygenase-like lactoylglutathione lyase family enzyme
VPWSLRSVLFSVRDLDRSLAFYRDVLGLRETTREGAVAVLGGEQRSFAMVLRQMRGEAYHYGQQALGPRAVTIDVGSQAELEGVATRLAAAGALVSRGPLNASEPFEIVTGRDPDGLPLSFIAYDDGQPLDVHHNLHVALRMYGIDV